MQRHYSMQVWHFASLISDDFHTLNILRPRRNGRHFTDDTFKHIFMNENVRISINISLKFVPKGLINNITALVQIMAWRLLGDKPLSEPMMVNLQTHICVTRPQWVNVHFANLVPVNVYFPVVLYQPIHISREIVKCYISLWDMTRLRYWSPWRHIGTSKRS